MPQPSDLYATMGAPGIYESSPSSSFLGQLPHVYVHPPEEEDDRFYCVFRGGPPSSTSFNSFYEGSSNSPIYAEFGHDLHRHDPFQQTRLVRSRISHWSVMYDAMPASSDAALTSCPSESESDLEYEEDGTCPISIQENEYDEDTSSCQDENIPRRPASRRSSFFGARPFDPHIKSNRATVLLTERRSNSFRNKAMTMLRRIGGSSNPPVDDVPQPVGNYPEHESWFELDRREAKRKHSQGTLRRLFAANSFKPAEINAACSQPSISKLSRRKSVLGLLRPSSSNARSDAVSMVRDPSEKIEALGTPTKLSRRHSISRLFGTRNVVSLTTSDKGKNMRGSSDETNDGGSNVSNETANFPAAMPASRPESPVSLASNASTARPLRRQSSFFRSSNFPINDLQRRESWSPAEESHQSPSEPWRSSVTDSLETPPEDELFTSPMPRSSDSLTTEDELQSPIQLNIPTIVLRRCDGDEIDILDEDFLPKDVDDGPFGIRHCSGAVHRPVVVDSPPMLDLAVRLNSLSFDTLAFDPDAFEDAIDDDP